MCTRVSRERRVSTLRCASAGYTYYFINRAESNNDAGSTTSVAEKRVVPPQMRLVLHLTIKDLELTLAA